MFWMRYENLNPRIRTTEGKLPERKAVKDTASALEALVPAHPGSWVQEKILNTPCPSLRLKAQKGKLALNDRKRERGI